MKIRELKENEPLKVIEVTERISSSWCNSFINKTDNEVLAEKDERVKIKTNVITDGEIEKQTEETSQDINEFYIGKRKYNYDVDVLKAKNLYFKNHSYVITYLIAAERMTFGYMTRWVENVKEVSVYLENIKDKKALREAKKVIKEINNLNSHTDYSSLFGMILSQPTKSERLETEKISKNIYTLKRTK